MNLDQLEALYLSRQSCREFSDEPLDDALVERICRAALLAPSARNAQPWKLIAATGEKKAELLEPFQHHGMNGFASKAGAIVLVTENKDGGKAGAAEKENEFVRNDLGILTAHLVLAAEAAGVGSCILGWRDEARLRALLSLPEGTRIPEAVVLGYPAARTPVREKKRKPFGETFTFLR